MISQGEQTSEAGDSERSGASLESFHEAERSVEAPASAPVEGGVEAQLRLLREYDALAQGGKGLFLRQHGLYTAQISAWRKIRDEKLRMPKAGGAR